MEIYKLRPHHVEGLINDPIIMRGIMEEEIIESTGELYGDINFAKKLHNFIMSTDKDTLVTITLKNDYICNELKCPFNKDCERGDYKKVSEILSSRLSSEMAKERVRASTPELSDRFIMRKYGLENGKTYRVGDLSIVNSDMRTDNL